MGRITFEELCENVSVDMLKEMVSECNGLNNSLEDYRMEIFDEEFFEIFFENPMDAARAVFFGNIQNWNDDYIRFNAYGNLESMSDYEYDRMLEDGLEEIVEVAVELYQENHLNLSSEIEELFDDYLNDDDEDDDED